MFYILYRFIIKQFKIKEPVNLTDTNFVKINIIKGDSNV